MARRRGRVPFGLWIRGFADIQHAVATAYDTLRESEPELYQRIANIVGAGAFLRIAVNKYVLKRVHKYIAEGKSPEEAAKEALTEALNDPNFTTEVEQYLKAMGLSDADAAALAEAAKAVLAKAVSLISKA